MSLLAMDRFELLSFLNRLENAQIEASDVLFKSGEIRIRVPLDKKLAPDEIQNEKNAIIAKVARHFPDYKVEPLKQ